MSTTIACWIVAVTARSVHGLGPLNPDPVSKAEGLPFEEFHPETNGKSSTLGDVSVSKKDEPDATLIFLTVVAAASTVLLILILTLYVLKRVRRSELKATFPAEDLTLHFGYDRNQNELPEDRFDIDKAHILGKGHFGTVYKGELTIKDTGERIPVAFKSTTTFSRFGDMPTLLSEVKILSHVGPHENIVKFYGACTKDHQKGIIHVALEFCALGSLDKYLAILRTNSLKQKTTKASKINSPKASNYESQESLMETVDLPSDCASTCSPSFEKVQHDEFHVRVALQWALEIAKGMEHLASRNVVHADLATRNLLLTENKSIKITDFGLSKKIYAKIDNSQTCTHDEDQRVPWKWLAPESLSSLIFSTKSDVWTYGIVLWEIFSLGEAPHQEFNVPKELIDFLNENGRLEKPQLCPNEIFDVMSGCWQYEPQERPTFTEIKAAVTQKDENYVRLQIDNAEQ